MTSFRTIVAMPRRKPVKKPQSCSRTLTYALSTNDSYCDLFRDLSALNRKLMRQGQSLVIEKVEAQFIVQETAPGTGVPRYDTVTLAASVAGDSWPVHNAWVKSKALWNEMNQLVLEDNPSVRGKWADYKVYLDDQMRTGTINLPIQAGGFVSMGEWNYSTFVLPQHDVDPVTGEPLPADETVSHLVGPDVGIPGALQSVGLVNAYQLSRATVFDNNPNVPAGMSDSFFNILTDSGSQEPELSLVIEYQNDDPPYDLDNYPGGAINTPGPVVAEVGVGTAGSPAILLSPFVAQCGLVRFDCNLYKDGVAVDIAANNVIIYVTVAAGDSKGVAAIPMGQ